MKRWFMTLININFALFVWYMPVICLLNAGYQDGAFLYGLLGWLPSLLVGVILDDSI